MARLGLLLLVQLLTGKETSGYGSVQACLGQALALLHILGLAPTLGILLQHHLRGIRSHLSGELVLCEKWQTNTAAFRVSSVRLGFVSWPVLPQSR